MDQVSREDKSAHQSAAALFPRSAETVASLGYLPSTSSTNTILAQQWRAHPAGLAPFTTLVTEEQTAGRGRLGRTWESPAGKSLLATTLLAFPVELRDQIGWIALMSALALREAVAESCYHTTATELAGGWASDTNADITFTSSSSTITFDSAKAAASKVSLKWPNDLMIAGKKTGGILGEYLGEESGLGYALVGIGLNVFQTSAELPVPTATSLLVTGYTSPSSAVRDRILARYLQGLQRRHQDFVAQAGDARAAGLMSEIKKYCLTLGSQVYVNLPDGSFITGTGIGITDAGGLQVQLEDGTERVVTSGDVQLVAEARLDS